MAIREYKCSCGVLTEKIIMGSNDIPEVIACSKCGLDAQFMSMPSSVALGRSTFSEAPLDVVIGKDADRKWDSIHTQQEVRDKVRKETGSVGLTRTKDGYAPISEETKQKRTELNDVLTQTGHKPKFDTSSDQKILGA
jgi:hypothetical protein